MRRIALLLLFICGNASTMASYASAAPAANEPNGSITMEISCVPNNNTVRLRNFTARTLSIEGWTLGTIYQPGPSEPFVLHDPAIGPGSGTAFLNGASKDRVLGGPSIFKNHPSEGARLITPYGKLEVLCSVGNGSLSISTLPGLPNTGGGYSVQDTRLSLVLLLPLLLGGGLFMAIRVGRGRGCR